MARPRNWAGFRDAVPYRVSFEAKQITHKAYERIRNPQTTEDEMRELHDYQREVSYRIPIPIDAPDIPEYP